MNVADRRGRAARRQVRGAEPEHLRPVADASAERTVERIHAAVCEYPAMGSIGPDLLDRVRAASAADPISAALVELCVLYHASFEQIAGLRRCDLDGGTVRFPPSRERAPGAAGVEPRVGLTLVPAAEKVLAPLREGRGPTDALLGSDADALRARMEALLAQAGAPAGSYVTPPGTRAEWVRHISETERGVVAVVEDPVGLWVLTETIVQGVRHRNGEPLPYCASWSHLDPLLPPSPRVLLLGGGVFLGAQLLEQRLAPSRLDVVEWDPRCVQLARTFFEWEPGPATAVRLTDAVAFVIETAARSDGPRWDVVLYDLADRNGLAHHLSDPTFARACATVAPVVAANLIGSLDGVPLASARAAMKGAGLEKQFVAPLRRRADPTFAQAIFVVGWRPPATHAREAP